MAERFEIVENTLQTLLEEKKYKTLRDILGIMNPGDIAAVFYGMDEERIPLLFRLLPKELAAETFDCMWTMPLTWWRKCPPTWSGGS